MSNEIATTILAQLGGNRFRAMTGASSFASGPNELSFRIPKRPGTGIKGCVIRLDPSDTYTIKFFAQKGAPTHDVIVVKEISDVYADQLQAIFSETTGLATSLGSMVAP